MLYIRIADHIGAKYPEASPKLYSGMRALLAIVVLFSFSCATTKPYYPKEEVRAKLMKLSMRNDLDSLESELHRLYDEGALSIEYYKANLNDIAVRRAVAKMSPSERKEFAKLQAENARSAALALSGILNSQTMPASVNVYPAAGQSRPNYSFPSYKNSYQDAYLKALSTPLSPTPYRAPYVPSAIPIGGYYNPINVRLR